LSPHWSRSDAQFDLWPWQRKQKKKEKRQWQTGYLPRPPTSPYRSQSLHGGWPPVCSSIFQVLLKSVQWFCHCGSVGGRKLPFPITLAIGLYNSLYYRTSRDRISNEVFISYIIQINTFNQNVLHCWWTLTSTTFRYIIT